MGHFLPPRPHFWHELPSVPGDWFGPVSVIVALVMLGAVMLASPEGPQPHHSPPQAAMLSGSQP